MSSSLFLKYRPQSFSEVVGQSLSAAALSRMVELDRLPSGLLFSGPSGTGKTSLARVVAKRQDGDSLEIDAASHRGVDNMRVLLETLRYNTLTRSIILDEAHNLTREAFNALLKSLEEPPPGTVFILVTTEPHKIPENVKSRLMEFEFRRLSSSEIHGRLSQIAEKEDITISDELLRLIADESDGNLRSAINALEFVHLSGIDSRSDYLEVNGSFDFAPDLMTLLIAGDYGSIFFELDSVVSRISDISEVSRALLSLLRDLLVLRAGGSLPFDGPYLEARRRLASELDRDQLMSSVRLLWDLRTKIKPSDDPRGSLEMCLILVSDILTKNRQNRVSSSSYELSPKKEKIEEKGRMSLSEMRSM